MTYCQDLFYLDKLSLVTGGFLIFFTLLTIIYSLAFMQKSKRKAAYYFYILLTLIASLGAVFSNNLIVFIVFWGFLGLLLYLLIGFKETEPAAAAAKKALIIIGGADALMLLGLAAIWRLSGSLHMNEISIALNSKLAMSAYLCLVCGAFAKAGAMPFHTWVPDTAENAPVPVSAFLPASLDKLLGIYFLARISLHLFEMNQAMNQFLMAIGSFTILAAVMMALVQHDLKRLLGYHAVSQVGYMVLGIGTGTPLGIAGGLFHMLNNTIYKTCLFFGGGAVEKKTGTTDLEKLGGYAKLMPITFFTFLIASLAISGIPPFNGFVSKWMIYQSIIETAGKGSYTWVLWLGAALFGSALTLDSFMKLIHTVFLGQPSHQPQTPNKPQETSPLMWIPTAILALFCVIFGVWAYNIPLRYFIFPSIGKIAEFPGMWNANLATFALLLGIGVGLIIYFLGNLTKMRQTNAFIGGEALEEHPDMRVSGTEFYDTIKKISILEGIYGKAQKGWFDIYEQGKNLIFSVGRFFRYLHNGVLPTYLVWTILGMLGLFWILLK